MKRWIWISLAALLVVAAGVTLVAVPRGSEWTTSSPEALAEFEAGADALNKVYYPEAQEHFRKAYELDPEFVIAKWRYAGALYDDDSERAEKLFVELTTADTSGLNPRETFFIERWRANREGRSDDAARLLDEYHAKYPTDPYILYIRANTAWNRRELEEAARLYQRLLKIDPNWVNAYNALGYISMMRGRFTESEEHFKHYRYIAPDQANPHDSLGELLITIGRYQEAEASLERAIETKPDFWASYFNIVVMNSYIGNSEGARIIIERARMAGMPEQMIFEMECLAHYSEMADREAWRQILDERSSECVDGFRSGLAVIVTHRAACRTGDWDTVQEIEDSASGVLLEIEGDGDGRGLVTVQADLLHMQGVRLATQGDFGAAADRFRAADDRLSFIKVDIGMYKLYNRMFLAETLLAAGKDAEAHKLLAQIRNTNPALVAEFETSGFRLLGLGRG
jgi:Flp pilus assembly protein TadD